MQSATAYRRSIIRYLPLILYILLLASCMQRYFFDVAVEDVRLSPAYQLNVENITSQALTFLPIRKYRPHYDPKVVERGEHISLLVQVNKIRVGETFTREIVAGPYIDSGRTGPDRADIQYRDSQDIKRQIVIDLSSDAWFESYSQNRHGTEARPKIITIRLTDETLSKSKWFAEGPNKP